mmetsp:Transcript_50502/g.110182  ORF Transcript_50502/g.110182 Transcript_50502/m.110182 type:complete len:246 (+) Transcript_50502:219-956(+)
MLLGIGGLVVSHAVVAQQPSLLFLFANVPAAVRVSPIVIDGIGQLILWVEVFDDWIAFWQVLDAGIGHSMHQGIVEDTSYLCNKGEGQGIHHDIEGLIEGANHQERHDGDALQYHVLNDWDANGPGISHFLTLQRQKPAAEVVVAKQRPDTSELLQVHLRKDPGATDETQQEDGGIARSKDLVVKLRGGLKCVHHHGLSTHIHFERRRRSGLAGLTRGKGEKTFLMQRRHCCAVATVDPSGTVLH